jgi:hypothetical protein
MWRKVMTARPPKSAREIEAARRAESTIRPPPDLELEDEPATIVQPLRWPEPPKDLAERLHAVRTDGIGLSRSVVAPPRPRRGWLLRGLVVAAILGAGIRLVAVRSLHRAAKPAALARPEPVAAVVSAAVPPPAARPPEVALPTPRPTSTKPPIDVTSLPKAAPSSPTRPAPRRIVKPPARTSAPAPAPEPDPGLRIDETSYDDASGAKGRTSAKNENPY